MHKYAEAGPGLPPPAGTGHTALVSGADFSVGTDPTWFLIRWLRRRRDIVEVFLEAGERLEDCIRPPPMASTVKQLIGPAKVLGRLNLRFRDKLGKARRDL
jgi:hypothetical protein